MAKIDLNNLSKKDSELIKDLLGLMNKHRVIIATIGLKIDNDLNCLALADLTAMPQELELNMKIAAEVNKVLQNHVASKLN